MSNCLLCYNNHSCWKIQEIQSIVVLRLTSSLTGVPHLLNSCPSVPKTSMVLILQAGMQAEGLYISTETQTRISFLAGHAVCLALLPAINEL